MIFRRRRLQAASRPPLDREERIVAWAGGVEGAGRIEGAVVVTNLGVWLPSAAPTRLGWHEIHKAAWSGRELSLMAAVEVAAEDGYSVVADLPPLVCTLLDADHVPSQVRTRVTRSIAYTSHHPLPGGGGVRVVARRVAGVDGLRWTVRYDDGTDASAQARAATAVFVAQARADAAP